MGSKAEIDLAKIQEVNRKGLNRHFGSKNSQWNGGNRLKGNHPCPQCSADRICEKRYSHKICAACHRSRPKNFDTQAWRLRTQQESKRQAMQLLGDVCNMCGVADLPPCCYQFDHLDPTAKKFNLGHKFNQKLSPAIIEEVLKCQLLCANCHAIKTWLIKSTERV